MPDSIDFSFNAESFRVLFEQAVSEFIAGHQEAAADDTQSDAATTQQLVEGMRQAVDVMQRADADERSLQQSDNAKPALEQADVTQIGDYTLSLLEGLVSETSTDDGAHNRELLRLTVPVSLWVARRGGSLNSIDMVVNSLASYANELSDTAQLATLAKVIREVIDAVSDEIRQDMEQTNMMRPWRILNLNYGIVATRSHDPELIDVAYAELVKNLPQDARQFFHEGMQQMDIVGYPEQVREVVARYDEMWGADSTLH
jgi:hypothetical protein